MKLSFPVMVEACEKHARSVLAAVGMLGCVAIYADFRGVVERQLDGYEKINESITVLASEVKSLREATNVNSVRLEHLEREHETARKNSRHE